jgi:hypothetical protein
VMMFSLHQIRIFGRKKIERDDSGLGETKSCLTMDEYFSASETSIWVRKNLAVRSHGTTITICYITSPSLLQPCWAPARVFKVTMAGEIRY